MIYEYTCEDRLETPHTYMYASYFGTDFLRTYKNDRFHHADRLGFKLQITDTGSIDRELLRFCHANKTDLPLAQFSLDSPIKIGELLGAILFSLCDRSPGWECATWLDRLVQRFEVSKKVYEAYGPGFRSGKKMLRRAHPYLLVSLALAVGYRKYQGLQYLSTLMKVNDLLLSLPPHRYDSEMNAELLGAIVAFELNVVREMSLKLGVKL